MTVSFHKYGDFFPGTGHLGDIGSHRGKHYSVNVPLREGMDDASYKYVFEPIMAKVIDSLLYTCTKTFVGIFSHPALSCPLYSFKTPRRSSPAFNSKFLCILYFNPLLPRPG
jgi:hypothetical protein